MKYELRQLTISLKTIKINFIVITKLMMVTINNNNIKNKCTIVQIPCLLDCSSYNRESSREYKRNDT